jgi:hypothetical protein
MNAAPFYRMCREVPAHVPPELIYEYDVYRPRPCENSIIERHRPTPADDGAKLEAA